MITSVSQKLPPPSSTTKMAETGCGLLQNGSNNQQELRAMESKKPKL
jgi:hypothetical protein